MKTVVVMRNGNCFEVEGDIGIFTGPFCPEEVRLHAFGHAPAFRRKEAILEIRITFPEYDNDED